jgi:hypothetical protein
MNILLDLRLVVCLLVASIAASSGQTVRERLKDSDFHAYTVIFGLTVDSKSKILTFHVSKVTDPKSGTIQAVEIRVPQSFIDAARKKAATKHYDQKLKDGNPVEFFTYYFYTPSHPTTVITDLDKSLEEQP